jgi:hypothetical protein
LRNLFAEKRLRQDNQTTTYGNSALSGSGWATICAGQRAPLSAERDLEYYLATTAQTEENHA